MQLANFSDIDRSAISLVEAERGVARGDNDDENRGSLGMLRGTVHEHVRQAQC